MVAETPRCPLVLKQRSYWFIRDLADQTEFEDDCDEIEARLEALAVKVQTRELENLWIAGVLESTALHIQDKFHINSPRRIDLVQEKQWKHHKKAKLKHVMVPSKEVEEAEFALYPNMWTCMCRAIIKEPDSKYFLSGITALEEGYPNPGIIPKNPGMARIGGRRLENPRYDDTFIRFHPAILERQPREYKRKNVGFVVHAHCWVLLNHIIPTTLIESKMEKFVRAARQYWRSRESWGANDYPFRILKRRQTRLRIRSGYWQWKDWDPKDSKYACDIYRSPLIVPEVQRAIESARKTKKERVQSRYSDVPLEVAIMIAELICPVDYTPADLKNTRNMLSVLQWTLPDWFWKRRLKEEIFIELNSLREANCSIDWQGLRLDLMGLVFDKNWYVFSGLPNRERVLGLMTGIKSNFLEKC
ncbi:hypothetical protein CBS147330_3664 [Penicillium roqueforti]|nr:hypothetical protein CBS147330_3664 [Penicillium roqueforti]